MERFTVIGLPRQSPIVETLMAYKEWVDSERDAGVSEDEIERRLFKTCQCRPDVGKKRHDAGCPLGLSESLTAELDSLCAPAPDAVMYERHFELMDMPGLAARGLVQCAKCGEHVGFGVRMRCPAA